MPMAGRGAELGVRFSDSGMLPNGRGAELGVRGVFPLATVISGDVSSPPTPPLDGERRFLFGVTLSVISQHQQN